MKYLVAGSVGFIGSCVVEGLCKPGHQVVGIDNVNGDYDISLKEARLNRVEYEKFNS